MALVSAGILMWRRRDQKLEVLLGHFGGPVWAKKDAGAWAMPKGLIEAGETPEACARREFEEETGARVTGPLLPLGRIRQKGGKWVEAFAVEGDFDPASLKSNNFTMEWPPRSGRFQSYAELDRVAWFTLDEAEAYILASQRPFLERLPTALQDGSVPPESPGGPA